MTWHKRISSKTLARLGRREFLSMSGASAALLPFVPLLEREADAAGQSNKRLFVFQTPNGSVLRNWRIEGLGHGDPLPETLSEILQPLAPWRDNTIVLDGIDNYPSAWAALGTLFMSGKGHQSSGSIWTQWAPEAGGPAVCDNDTPCTWPNGPSFDQYAAERIGDQTPFSVINPNVYARRTDRSGNVFYDANGQPVVGENQPGVMFEQLFANLNLDPAEKERLKAERRSVIDSVAGDLDSLKVRLGAGDRRKIDAHLEGVRALEQAIDGLDAVCEIPTVDGSLDPRADANLPIITDLQIEIAVNALACDLTRVVGFKWGNEGSTGVATWVGFDTGIHTTSHWQASGGEAGSIQLMTDLNHWFAQKVALIAEKLDARGILDETLVVWGNTMCEGAAHNARNIPMVLLQGDGYFDTGRYLKYGNFPSIVPDGQGGSNEDYGGESMNRLITSLCHSMGFDDVDSYGDPLFGMGTLPAL